MNKFPLCKPFPNKKYRIIYADPPWLYSKRNKNTSFGLGMHRYAGMNLDELLRMGKHIKQIASTNCALFMWHCAPKYYEYPIQSIFDAWGFRYITKAFVWIKISKKGKPRLLTGHYTGSNSEDCFLGIRGRMQVKDKGVNQVVTAPLTKHSEKPNEVKERIVRLFGDLPRIELFARKKTPGWDVWGNEI